MAASPRKREGHLRGWLARTLRRRLGSGGSCSGGDRRRTRLAPCGLACLGSTVPREGIVSSFGRGADSIHDREPRTRPTRHKPRPSARKPEDPQARKPEGPRRENGAGLCCQHAPWKGDRSTQARHAADPERTYSRWYSPLTDPSKAAALHAAPLESARLTRTGRGHCGRASPPAPCRRARRGARS